MRILAVEDDPVIQHLLKSVFERLRLRYHLAASGAEATAFADRVPLDAVLLDVGLPDTDGLSLVRELRTRPQLEDLPFVMCTSAADVDTVMQAAHLGVVDYVRKPIAVADFQRRMHRLRERVPARWAPLAATLRRLQTDRAGFRTLLAHARDDVTAVGTLLSSPAAAKAEVTAAVRRLRSTAVEVGALRTIAMIDRVWRETVDAAMIDRMARALRIELRAFEEELGNLAAA